MCSSHFGSRLIKLSVSCIRAYLLQGVKRGCARSSNALTERLGGAGEENRIRRLDQYVRRRLGAKIGRLASIRPGETLIFPMHEVLAIGPLEPANDEVAACDVLEVLDERVIHGGAAQRADHRDGLRRSLLRHHHAEARRDLGDEANEDGAAFLDDT